MQANELIELTVIEALAGLDSGKFSHTEYVSALIDRCHASAHLNAFVSWDPDTLVAEARQLDNRTGSRKGALEGIPLAIKDNINTTRLTSAGGTTVLRRFRPRANAPVAQSLFDAGALLGGKANMHELAFGATTNNGATGASRNPYDPDMIPGGSSGGTAVAVAQRMMPAGIGTDTGTSVRLPSSLCGIFGFRPSIARYSRKGIIPCSLVRDTAGAMTRSAADAALIDAVMAGKQVPVSEGSLQGVRIGIPRKHFHENLDPEVARVSESFLDVLQKAGARLVEVEVRDVAALNSAFSFTVCMYEFRRDLALFLKEHGYDISLEEVCAGIGSPDVKGVMASQLGPDAVSDEAYHEAMTVLRPRLLAAYANCYRENSIEAMAFPVAPLPARPIGQDETVELNGEQVSTIFTYIRNTDPGSNADQPAASIPSGLTRTGLPVGMQLEGPTGSDDHLLGMAQSIERIIGVLPPPGI